MLQPRERLEVTRARVQQAMPELLRQRHVFRSQVAGQAWRRLRRTLMTVIQLKSPRVVAVNNTLDFVG